MANISDEKLNHLIDKIGKLTYALEHQTVKNESSSRRRSYDDWYKEGRKKEWGDLTDKDLSKIQNKKYKETNSLKKEYDDLGKELSDKGKKDKIRIKELEDLKKNTLLLSEMAKYDEEIKKIKEETKKLEKERQEILKKKTELEKQSLKEYYQEKNPRQGEPKEGTKKAWRRLSKEDKKGYGSFDNYRQSVEDKRTSNLIDEYDLGDTAVGKYARSRIDFRDRIRSYGRMGKAMQGEAGKKMAGAVFGHGKAGAAATKALGGFGKGLTAASKALGKFVPGLNILLAVIDVMHGIGEVMGEWKKHNANIIKYQTQYEKLTYEHDKQIANLEVEQQVSEIEYDKDIQMKMLDVQGQNMLEAIDIQNKQITNSVSAAVGGITQGITESAYQAASNQIDYQADYLKYLKGKETREGEQERYHAVRGGEFSRDIALNRAERNIVDITYQSGVLQNQLEKEHFLQNQVARAASVDNLLNFANPFTMGEGLGNLTAGVAAFTNTDSHQRAISDGKNVSWGGTSEPAANVNPVSGGGFQSAGRINDNGVGKTAINGAGVLVLGKGWLEGKQTEETAQLDNTIESWKRTADWQKTVIDLQYKQTLTQEKASKELIDEQAKLAKDVYGKEIEKWREIEKIWLGAAQKIEEYWKGVDEKTNITALNQGILTKEQRTNFQKYLQNITNNVASYYGKTAVEVAATQAQYSEGTGRNKTMGEGDYEKLYYMGTRIGDDSLAAEYGSRMEIFNHGVETSVDLLDEALDDVNRIGLNGKKYAKDLVNNLKLAQKYNFRGGTKELMQMAKWAQQTRFNLGSLSGMIDKVQEGGLEGTITQAAGFQVLGGQAAINSDPLGMMFDAWADPQAYAKRMQDMTKGFGRFNSKTGETEFNINESMQIAQMAKLQGRSAEELRGEIMQRNKQNSVNRQLSEYANFNDEQKAMISNKAEYENGRWVVKMNNGESMDVSKLSANDLENLMPKGHEERMEALQKEGVGYLRDIVSYAKQTSGEEEREKGSYALELWDKLQDETRQRIENMHNAFIQEFETNTSLLSESISKATNAQKSYLGIYTANAETLKEGQSNFDEAAGKITDGLNNLAVVIEGAITRINGAYITDWTQGHTRYTSPNATPVTPVSKPTSSNVSRTIVPRGAYDGNADELPDGVVSAMGKPMLVSAKQITPISDGVANFSIHDGMTSGGGTPMFVSAKQVTPVRDGAAKMAKTDARDTALFAKVGGPFDKLFDDIFGKVNAIYNMSVQHSSNSMSSNSYGSNMIQSMLENHFANVFGSNSTTNNRYGGNMVQSMLQNYFANVFGSNSILNNSYGGDVSNVFKRLLSTAYGGNNSNVSNVSDGFITNNSNVSNVSDGFITNNSIVGGNANTDTINTSNLIQNRNRLVRSSSNFNTAFTNTSNPFESNIQYGSATTTNSRYVGDMVQSILENSFANVFGSGSTTNNRYTVGVNRGNNVSNEYSSLLSNRYDNGVVYPMSENYSNSVSNSKSTSNNKYGGSSLSMMFDAWTAPQAYTKRIEAMPKGFGRRDTETGEIAFNIGESMQMQKLAKIMGRSYDDIRSEVALNNGLLPQDNNTGYNVEAPYSLTADNGSFNERIDISDLNLNISGKLELTGENGQSINIIEELRSNPMFVRQITEMIVLQMNNNTHGGRNELFHNRFSG